MRFFVKTLVFPKVLPALSWHLDYLDYFIVDFLANVSLVFIACFTFTEDENCLFKYVKIREYRLHNLILISKNAVRYLLFEKL